MKLKAWECSKCKDLIFSRSRHDMRSCSCGAFFVDGGFDYCKMSFDPKVVEKYGNGKFVEIKVKATREELHNDWNLQKNKFGLIKGKGTKGKNGSIVRSKN